MIVASKSFVEMPRTIDRQLFTHSGKYLEGQHSESKRAEAISMLLRCQAVIATNMGPTS